jgi:hypothetical protein
LPSIFGAHFYTFLPPLFQSRFVKITRTGPEGREDAIKGRRRGPKARLGGSQGLRRRAACHRRRQHRRCCRSRRCRRCFGKEGQLCRLDPADAAETAPAVAPLFFFQEQERRARRRASPRPQPRPFARAPGGRGVRRRRCRGRRGPQRRRPVPRRGFEEAEERLLL